MEEPISESAETLNRKSKLLHPAYCGKEKNKQAQLLSLKVESFKKPQQNTETT